MADNSDSVPPRVTFTVKAASNVRCELSMDPAATVSQLKDELAAPDKADVPADRQRLVYAGRVLRNGQRICDYNIKNGHTVHLVRSATSNNNPSGNTAANAATRTPSSSSTTSDPTRAAAAAAAEAQGVPTNIAAGNGNDPLVGLTGARYAGFTQLPGASSLLNPESGPGSGHTPEDMIRLLENPQYQSMLNEALSNPQLIEAMIQQNPVLRSMGPTARHMLSSPAFRRMVTDPNSMRQVAQMQPTMERIQMGQNGAAAFPEPGITSTTEGSRDPQQQQQQQQQQAPPLSQPVQAGNHQNLLSLLSGMNSTDPNTPPQSSLNLTLNNLLTNQLSNTPPQPQPQPPSTTAPAPTAEQNPFASLFNPSRNQDQDQNQQQPQSQPQRPLLDFSTLDQSTMSQIVDAAAAAAAGGGTANLPAAPANPFADLLNSSGLGGALGGGLGGGTPVAALAPPEERYRTQLQQLNDMGFTDFNRNVQALTRSDGHVERAVEFLLGG